MYTPSLYAAFLAALTFDSVSAHMEMSWPPPLRSKKNPFAGSDIDYSMTSPLSASGSDYPCKGTLGLLGTAAAAPVASWQAGQTYNLTIEGGANHNGGSCQASLSFDGGKTFKVVKSYVGGCPPAGTSTYDFTLPDDTPAADDALFAWTWFNQVGNREMYMNCAVVSTKAGGSAKRQATSFNSRPDILVANVGNGCSTTEGSDVEFPNPGASIATANSKTAPPVGSCGSAAGGGGGGGGDAGASPDQGNTPNPGDGAPPASSPSKTGANPVPTTPATEPGQPGSGPVTTSTTLPGGVFIPQPSPEAPKETVVTPPVETGNAPPPAKPTTLATVTTTAGTGGAPKPTSTPGSGTGNGSNAGVQKPGVACANEGQWNCVGGSQFQRCASGLWSVLMQMAPGTSCETGISEALVMFRSGSRIRRFVSPRYLA
ncbi:hypothetical protein HYQ45_005694 [Verticillium longisporum]|uniref:Chitin-binding type-4 domain-containing protein n=1 Tax=Verticillium longisporum TaxID=100787 RepID=A0A0G4MTV7_VERLO|nr:hypothetical protein HYQ44_007750 [Verticillium longisporum]KAG7136816.1 hypothetical protein HYQ45_005694 [Verticillium longisporum]CRK37415.1 hypothetical protein BN1708_001439 [Verticillium longisporum]